MNKMKAFGRGYASDLAGDMNRWMNSNEVEIIDVKIHSGEGNLAVIIYKEKSEESLLP